jgi:SAM-dependent methyltransferase
MAYVISELNLERQKLLGKVLAPVTDRLLSALQLRSGVRDLDLGCGMGETTRQLARTLDKPNEIVALELNPDLVETAKKLSSGEQDGVSFEQGDVSALEFADNSFDFVFARYLLMHLFEPEAVLKEMLRVCKSGGAVAVQEPDFSFQRCYPDSWAYERLPDLFRRLFPDAFLGPKLWSLFQKLGYSSSNVLVDCMVEVNQNDLRRCYRLSVEVMEKAVIEKGIYSESEFERLRAELERVEKGKIFCAYRITFLCVGGERVNYPLRVEPFLIISCRR